MFNFKNLIPFKSIPRKQHLLTQSEVDVFIAAFAHDIRNLSGSILTVHGLLAADELDLKRQALAASALYATFKKIQDVTEEAIEKSKGYSESSSFSVAALVREAHEMIGYQSTGAEIVAVEIQSDFITRGDPKAFYRGIHNLLSNACAAVARSERTKSERAVTVTVKTESCSSGVTKGIIEVTDNGVGMEPGQISRIWEKGFTNSGPGGHGIGMSVVKLAFEHLAKGSINVISKEGIGTTFVIRLPIVER